MKQPQLIIVLILLLLPLIALPQQTSKLSLQMKMQIGAKFSALSPDGRYLVVNNYGNSHLVYDVKKGVLLQDKLPLDFGQFYAILPDSKTLLCQFRKLYDPIQVVDLVSSKLLGTFTYPLQVFSEDGKWIAYSIPLGSLSANDQFFKNPQTGSFDREKFNSHWARHVQDIKQNKGGIVYLKSPMNKDDSIAIQSQFDKVQHLAISAQNDKIAVIGQAIVLNEKEDYYAKENSPIYLDVIDRNTTKRLAHIRLSDDSFQGNLAFSDGGDHLILSDYTATKIIHIKTGEYIDWIGQELDIKEGAALYSEYHFSADDNFLFTKTYDPPISNTAAMPAYKLSLFDLKGKRKRWEKTVRLTGQIAIKPDFSEAAFFTSGADYAKPDIRLNVINLMTSEEKLNRPAKMWGGLRYTAEGQQLLFADDGDLSYLDMKSHKEVVKEETLKAGMVTIDMDLSGSALIYWYYGIDGLKSMNLTNGFQITTKLKASEVASNFIHHPEDRKAAYLFYKKENNVHIPRIAISNTTKKSSPQVLSIPENEAPGQAVLSPSGRYLSYPSTKTLKGNQPTYKMFTRIVDLQNQKALGTIQPGFSAGWHHTTAFSRDDNFLYFLKTRKQGENCLGNAYAEKIKTLANLHKYNPDEVDYTFQKMEVKSGKVKACLRLKEFPTNLTLSRNRRHIALMMNTHSELKDEVKILDENLKEVKTINIQLEKIRGTTSEYHLAFSEKGDQINVFLYNSASNRVECRSFDIFSGRQVDQFELADASFSITSPSIYSNDQYLLTTTRNGNVTFFDLEQKKKSFDIFFKGPEDFIVVTPDNYYYSTSDAVKSVRFRTGNESFPFRQFDLLYNRPDLVLKQIKGIDPVLITSYYKAYQKRLEKLGFEESKLKESKNLPTVKILTTDLPVATSQRQVAIQVVAKDKNVDLDRLNVWVNDVPLFGRKGINLKDRKTKSLKEVLEIPLGVGKNQVLISCLNADGVESLTDGFEITYNGSTKKPDLYLFALGASQYAQSEMNLNFAAKDAQEMARLFAGAQGIYNKIHTEVLINEQVTFANLKQLKRKLQTSTIDDVVILYLSGHGLVDRNLDYYLASHDVDFKNPSGKGIPYSQLEHLLDNIPARKKLILLDACHSGEIDKENIIQLQQENTTQGKVRFKSFDTRLASRQIGLQNSFELMKELFVDLRRGTGATVISSASGVEFALEGERWQNGVFTFAMLAGLQNKIADLNKDGQIMVSELQYYLAKEVSRLTEGQQRPTFRLENFSNDWRIW